uniref:Uncharacterized protein n=1 Tax=Rhizophora mucronata TaxID=61149 RepID=A0A2P2PIS0_RHIMU
MHIILTVAHAYCLYVLINILPLERL